MNFSEIENIAKQIKIDKAAIDHAKILADAQAALKKPEKILSAQNKPSIWRIIMYSKTLKLATVAVIIIAVTLTINHLGGSIDGSTVAWASLAEKVQLQTCFYKNHTETTGGILGEKVIKQEIETYLSSDYGIRMNVYGDGNLQMSHYMIPKEKIVIVVMPESKKYLKMVLTDKKKEQVKSQDPREIVKKLISKDYTNLGKSIIDGITVEGIENTNPKAYGGQFDKYITRCWVNVETQMPVLIEIETEVDLDPNSPPMKMFIAMDSFEWDIDIAPEIFEPNIPEDYEMMAQMQMPEQTEVAAVKGLEVFAEVADGKYPTKLTMLNVMKEFPEILKHKYEQQWHEKQETDPNFKQTEEEKEQIIKRMMPEMMKVQGAGMFYAKLVQENKDPAYYGNEVTANDVDLPLLRWRLDDGQYRVIYGDLSCETVTPEQLSELEAKVPQ